MNEAREITQFMGGIHHSRKIAHQQVSYSETVKKLSEIQTKRIGSPTLQRYPNTYEIEVRRGEEHHQRAQQYKNMKLREYEEKMKTHILEEKFINTRKKEYNRETGRKAIVNQVISGTAPMPNHVLFPHGATHEQILAMTGTLKVPDARIVPPEVPKLRKWKGDGVGWN